MGDRFPCASPATRSAFCCRLKTSAWCVTGNFAPLLPHRAQAEATGEGRRASVFGAAGSANRWTPWQTGRIRETVLRPPAVVTRATCLRVVPGATSVASERVYHGSVIDLAPGPTSGKSSRRGRWRKTCITTKGWRSLGSAQVARREVNARRVRLPAGLTIKQRMARKLATKQGAAVYARRKVIPEPVFGQIKEARGFRRFLLRGLVKVRGEWSLVALTHNLLKLHAATG